MVRATKPFEYLHADFFELPTAWNGMRYVLTIVDDLSLTTLLHPTEHADHKTVATALLHHWLAYYPDPILMHTDGGRHFDNQVIRYIAKTRGWKTTMSTVYAKWAHGVAE